MQGANISQIGILEAFPLISKPLGENSVFKTILYQQIGNDKNHVQTSSNDPPSSQESYLGMIKGPLKFQTF